MPLAVAPQATERYELKTCPPDGFVVLRMMNYGQKHRRSELSTDLSITEAVRSRGTVGGKQTRKTDVTINQGDTAFFDFRHSIMEHNLQDENGQLLDFSVRQHVDALNPMIGDEISDLIAILNGFNKEDEEADSEDLG